MSIYITNMDIPKDEAVALYIYPDGRVKLWRPQAVVSHEYKAVPVPPHGDLIDRNELEENCMKEDSFLAELLFRKVSNAPTIIPAEEGEI